MIIEIHRFTRDSLCIHQDDAMGRYDRIIRNHAILCNQKFGNNLYKLHYHTHDKMQFKIQIKNKLSSTSYHRNLQLKLRGVGQGAGNGGTH